MRQVFKTIAMLLGCTGCIAAQTAKNSLTNNIDATLESNETDTSPETNTNPRALAFLQDIDKIYFL